jgi:hypothetical protein
LSAASRLHAVPATTTAENPSRLATPRTGAPRLGAGAPRRNQALPRASDPTGLSCVGDRHACVRPPSAEAEIP